MIDIRVCYSRSLIPERQRSTFKLGSGATEPGVARMCLTCTILQFERARSTRRHMSLYNDPVSKKIMLIGVLAFIHEDHNNLEVPAMVRGAAFKNELVPGRLPQNIHCIALSKMLLICFSP
jgi:hypothetical protein